MSYTIARSADYKLPVFDLNTCEPDELPLDMKRHLHTLTPVYTHSVKGDDPYNSCTDIPASFHVYHLTTQWGNETQFYCPELTENGDIPYGCFAGHISQNDFAKMFL